LTPLVSAPLFFSRAEPTPFTSTLVKFRGPRYDTSLSPAATRVQLGNLFTPVLWIRIGFNAVLIRILVKKVDFYMKNTLIVGTEET
jgi:hypothetical protein